NAGMDARESARPEGRDPVDGTVESRVESEKALADAAAALTDARARLKTAEGTPARSIAAARAVSSARKTIASEEIAVQEARTAFDKGEYRPSIDKAAAATARLRASTRDLEVAVPTSGRRRR